jgi:protein ImuB
MDRRACVDLPALPLQILFRSHPGWQNQPAVVVDRDKPQGVILWSNERARKFRILPGMRYAAGLALERELRAGVVPENQITREVDRLTRRLGNFTSGVEPCTREPGIFWLNANGLGHLFSSFQEWATAIRQNLNRAGFRAFISVGFTRFGSYNEP